MRKLILVSSVVFLTFCLMASCSDEKKSDDEVKTESLVVVKVNSEEITEEEVAKEANRLLQQMTRERGHFEVESLRPQAREQAVSNLVNRNLLEQAAEAGGYSGDPEKAMERIQQIRDRFDTEEDYQNQLASSGVTEEELEEEMIEGTKIEALIDEWISGVGEIEDSEAKEYYNDNIEQFQNPQRVRASHIVLRVDSNTTEQERIAKREQLAGIRRDIEQGADFAEMAIEHSEGPSSSRGGDLGFFGRGQMVKPFEEAAFNMEKGELSDLVESRFGYHLIKVTDRQEAGTTPFDEAKEQIKNILQNSKKREVFEEHLDSLREASNIEYADSTLAQ
jgi:peptidyl-prolyl cis-trans isomerase C